MIHVSVRDALRALKKFKRLAKQDLLASELTDEPQFWRRQAEARRATYDVLMRLVADEGVGAAHRYAVEQLAALPLFRSANAADASAGDGLSAPERGRKQALELFVSMLGRQAEDETALPSA